MFEAATEAPPADPPLPGLPVALGDLRLPWPERHPLAHELQGQIPSAELAGTLAALHVADVDHPALVEMISAWERVISWATARQAQAMAELTRRFRGGEQLEFATDEVMGALRVSGRAAQNKMHLAQELDVTPRVHDALERGAIDVRKAQALLKEIAHLQAAEADAVLATVLPEAPELTVPQIRSAVRHAELAVDPQAVATRHRAARKERCVRMTSAPDAMAWLNVFLPADDAVAVLTSLDALATAAAPEDPRTMDARRVDALVDVLRRPLDLGLGPDGTELPRQQRRRPHLHVTVAAGTLLGLDDGPGYLGGYGPIPAGMARRIARDATWRAVLTDPVTGETTARGTRAYRPGAVLAHTVLDRDVTCTFPGCRVPAARCDIDHIEPFDPNRGGAEQNRPDNLQALCRHHHRLKTHTAWQVARDPVTGVTMWTSPAGKRLTRQPVATDPRYGASLPRTGSPSRSGSPPDRSGSPPELGPAPPVSGASRTPQQGALGTPQQGRPAAQQSRSSAPHGRSPAPHGTSSAEQGVAAPADDPAPAGCTGDPPF